MIFDPRYAREVAMGQELSGLQASADLINEACDRIDDLSSQLIDAQWKLIQMEAHRDSIRDNVAVPAIADRDNLIDAMKDIVYCPMDGSACTAAAIVIARKVLSNLIKKVTWNE